MTVRAGCALLVVMSGLVAVDAPTDRLAVEMAATPAVDLAIAFDARGLSSLRWRGAELLVDGAVGASWADHVWLAGDDGRPVAAALDAQVRVDAEHGVVERTCAWGVIRTTYRIDGDRLAIATDLTDRSPRTILAAQLRLALLRFPSRIAEYDGRTPLLVTGVDEPGILAATFTGGRVAICADDDRPLVIGLPWAEGHPADTVMPLVADTGHREMMPDSLRAIDRPIAPGCTDRIAVSLRFGAADAPLATLAADRERAFLARHPPTLAWPDRRPIGTLHCATTVPHVPANPRGWFEDRSIDTTTDAGRAVFAARLRAYVAGSIAELQRVGAQGVIVWDIEGQEWPHATSYLGDPRHLPPEMEPLADGVFAAYADAGLRTGITIRPQALAAPAYGDGRPDQVDVGEDAAAQVLIDKIAYARKRWGCTLFYVDSNVTPSPRADRREHAEPSWQPFAAAVFARVAAAHPDVLLIPEHKTAAYWAGTAPYGELRQGFTGTPAAVSELYPTAFSVIYLPDTDQLAARRDELVAAARRGDVLLFRSWFHDPVNDELIAIRRRALETAP